jgi:hypothetical protein
MKVERKFRSPVMTQRFIINLIADALQSHKIGDQKITQDNWLALAELFTVVTGLKPTQGHKVELLKAKPRGPAVPISARRLAQIQKKEQREKAQALAQAETDEKAQAEETKS